MPNLTNRKVIRLNARVTSRCAAPILILVAALLPGVAWSEDIYDNYAKLIQSGRDITSPGDQIFGENISLYTGSLEIVQTDVDLKGNNALQVRIGRRFSVGSPTKGHFNLWDLDIPNLHGVYGIAGWVADAQQSERHKRCSLHGQPPLIQVQDGFFEPTEYWHGSFAYLPGSGDQEFLWSMDGAHTPNDGHAYPIVLKDRSAIRCTATLDGAAQTGMHGGEGFELVDPQGTTFTFNHMVSRHYPAFHRSTQTPIGRAAAASTTDIDGVITPAVGASFNLLRKEYLIYPTKVMDRFGNTVSYNWNPAAPWQLLSIVSSDGRRIDLSYAGQDGELITSVTADGRKWSYNYLGDTDSVTLPDGSMWTFDLLDLSRARVIYGSAPPGCDNIRSHNKTATGNIVAPTGARADYVLNSVVMGRSWVTRYCVTDESYSKIPYQFETIAITSRKISGAGLPAEGLTWLYDYGTPNNCWIPSPNPNPRDASKYVECNASSPSSRDVYVKDPTGSTTRYRFGNRYWDNEGLLLQQDFGWTGTASARSIFNEYASHDASPYAAGTMYSAARLGDSVPASRYRPLRQRTTIENGNTFVWRVADCGSNPCFDKFARPLKVEQYSVP